MFVVLRSRQKTGAETAEGSEAVVGWLPPAVQMQSSCTVPGTYANGCSDVDAPLICTTEFEHYVHILDET